MAMAQAAKALIEANVFYTDGTPVECVVSPCTIGGGAEAAKCAEFFATQNVCATLSVTPCWCYGSETMDLDPLTVKPFGALTARSARARSISRRLWLPMRSVACRPSQSMVTMCRMRMITPFPPT